MFRASPLLLHRSRIGLLSASPLAFLSRENPTSAEAAKTQAKASQLANASGGSVHSNDAVRTRTGFNTASLYRQISMGSILGVATGLVLAKFSHLLAFGAGAIAVIVEVGILAVDLSHVP